VSESPGRNASERELAPKDPNPGGRAVDYPAKAIRADAVWLTRSGGARNDSTVTKYSDSQL